MLDFAQTGFNRAEEIADALDAQDGVQDALMEILPDALAAPDARQERMVMALMGAMAHYRATAAALAQTLAQEASEAED